MTEDERQRERKRDAEKDTQRTNKVEMDRK